MGSVASAGWASTGARFGARFVATPSAPFSFAPASTAAGSPTAAVLVVPVVPVAVKSRLRFESGVKAAAAVALDVQSAERGAVPYFFWRVSSPGGAWPWGMVSVGVRAGGSVRVRGQL